MKNTIEIITPKRATELLALNTCNRKLRQSRVDDLTTAILRGEWLVSPQGISVSWDNELIDGQHRLEAVKKSGASVPMVVWTDVDPAVFPITDVGSPRTIADITKLPKRQTEVLNFFHALTASATKPTAAQILKLDGFFNDEISRLHTFAPTAQRGFSTVGVRSAVVILAKEGQLDRAFDIYRRLTTSDFGGLPNIVNTFIKQVVNGTAATGNGGVAQVQLFCKTLLALDKRSELDGRKTLYYSDLLRDESVNRIKKWVL